MTCSKAFSSSHSTGEIVERKQASRMCKMRSLWEGNPLCFNIDVIWRRTRGEMRVLRMNGPRCNILLVWLMGIKGAEKQLSPSSLDQGQHMLLLDRVCLNMEI